MNILLITDMPPCNNYTAGIVQKHLSHFLLNEGHCLSCFAIIDPVLSPEIPQDILKNIEYSSCAKPKEGYGQSKYGKLASLVFNNYNAVVRLPKIAKMVEEFSVGKNIDLIWAVVQGQTMIKLIRPLANRLKVPYTVEVWDPPQWWLSENRFDAYTYKSVMKEFSRLIQNSQCCMAASWNMAEEYSNLYKAKAIPVIPSLDESLEIKPLITKQSDEFVIGFAGQMYAKDEFKALLEALDRLGWNYNEKKIKIVLYGSYFNLVFDQSANVLVRGWVKQEQVLQELAGFDLLYCPYWFSESFEIVAKLSFPSKLTTYLKTKTPVFVHAPQYASISQFITNGENGFVCSSVSIKNIVTELKKIIELDERERKTIGENGYKSYVKNLTAKSMKRSFFSALGLNEKDC